MFYNTINLEGDKLKEENSKTLFQEDLIKLIYESNPTLPISPSQILSIFNDKYARYVPITSIRRGITNLTERKVLLKTTVLVKGLYHLPEHCWILATGNEKRDDIKTEKFQTPTIAEYATKLIPQGKPQTLWP